MQKYKIYFNTTNIFTIHIANALCRSLNVGADLVFVPFALKRMGKPCV